MHPWGFGRGDFYGYTPAAIRTLPIGLLRSHLYPPHRQEFIAAVQQYLDGRQPVALMPQRMAFDKYKTPPVQTGWGQSAISAVTAMAHGPAHVRAPPPPAVPFAPATRVVAQRGLNRMPVPTDSLSVNMRQGYVPLARDAVPADTVTDARVVNQVSADARAPQHLRPGTPHVLRMIEAQRRHFAAVMSNQTRGPWFLR